MRPGWRWWIVWLGLGGCVGHRGTPWRIGPPDPPLGDDGISIVVLGDAVDDTRAARATAAEVDRVVEAERAAGRVTVVLWAGSHTHGRRFVCPARDVGALAPSLAEVMGTHAAAGTPVLAVAGPVEWTCGFARTPPAAAALASEALPEVRAGSQYVVALGVDGSAEVRLWCTAAGCDERPPTSTTVLELVMVDTTPWVSRSLGERDALEALDALLAALQAEPVRPPRIVVSHLPIEAAGVHGTAGYDADATIHTLYPPLRDAVLSGAFDGVVAAHDHATYAIPDISDALKRADRRWTEAPLWQVVAGAAADPVAHSHRIAPRTRYFTSMAYVPETYTPHPGFALVRIDGNEVRAVLFAKRGAWETTTVAMPLRSPPHPPQTPSPPMQPCVRCPEVPASER